MDKDIKLLKNISELSGVSGNEKKVRLYIKQQLENQVDEIFQDNLGSLIAKKGQKGPTIMVAGHMDEVGLMITQITKDGFLKFQTIGGWYNQVMLAQEWLIETITGKEVIGVTGVKPPHVIPANKRNEVQEASQMFIDVGASSYDEVIEMGIRLGSFVTPLQQFRQLGDQKHLLGKAWDNRIGSAVVIEVMRNLKAIPNQIYGTFTVQEEVGLRGAKTSSHLVKPEIVIALDSGIALEIPGAGEKENQEIGKGPQILIYDGGLIPNQALRNLVIKTAEELNIPYQEAYIVGGRTDAGNMHLAHNGAAGLSICIPTRNLHSHVSMIHYDDYLNTVKLLSALLIKLDQTTVDKILDR